MAAHLTELQNRAAVISGAASGLGRELALACASRGMQLVLADVDASGLEQTRAMTGVAKERALLARCDVSRADEVDQLAEAARERFGAVHLLFNNAGVMAAGPIWKATAQDWAWLFGVNVMGVANAIRSFVPAMLDKGEPAWIVNTASLAGLVCPAQMSVYSASKHAVVAMSECLHHELAATGKPIGVSVLCPAWFETGIANADRHRPADLSSANPDNEAHMQRMRDIIKAGRLTAADIARITLDAVAEGRFYVLPHRKALGAIERRMRALVDGAAPDDPMA
jgi:NAD(P)-dependent dehydrogenase (short-subunit alcohol dehydrogenase family)